MSTDQTTNIGLPFLMPAQAQKHITVNESLTRLDALVQTVVESRTRKDQPATPGDGAVWICPPGKTGPDWAGFANWDLAYFRDGAWESLTPRTGWRAWISDESIMARFDGSVWIADGAMESVNGGQLGGLRNVVINGGFDIWQRGDSVTGTDLFGPDRWIMNSSGATQTLERVPFGSSSEAAPMGWPANHLRMSMAASENFAGIMHRIEDVRTLAGGAATISFWAKHAGAAPSGNIRVNLIQNFGFNGTNQNTSTREVALSSNWKHYNHNDGLTFELPGIDGLTLGAGHSLRLLINNAATEIWDLDITCVQIERGRVATKFERRPPAMELALCRRYYRRYETAQTIGDLAFEMRTAPIQTGSGPFNYSAEI